MAEIEWNRLASKALSALAEQGAIVLLPVASTEQHGPHLPTGVDDFLVSEVCRRSARMLTRDPLAVVAPTVWCGLADHHVALGGTFTISLATYHALLRDLCRSIIQAGFRRIVLVNGHVGNVSGLAAITADLTRELAAPIATTTYFMEAADDFARVLQDQDCLMHACEAETSMMLALAPDLVDASQFPDAQGTSFDLAASFKPTLRRFTFFTELTKSGVLGDARRATNSKGEALLAACSAALAERLQAGEPWTAYRET